MPKTSPLTPHFTLICPCGLLFSTAAQGQAVASAKSRFVFKDADGKTDSAEVVTKYAPKKIVRPFAKMDSSVDSKLRRAASIAEERAHAHSREKFWHYLKQALLASGSVNSYSQTAYGKEAATELVSTYGFTKLRVGGPYQAPV